MNIRKVLIIVMCLTAFCGITAPAETVDVTFIEEIPDASEYIEEEIPDAAEEFAVEPEASPDGSEAVITADETDVDLFVETQEQAPVYALLKEDTSLYADPELKYEIGYFEDAETVLLVNGMPEAGDILVKFECGGRVETGYISYDAIRQCPSDVANLYKETIPAVRTYDTVISEAVQKTPDMWVREHTGDIFPRKVKYEEAIYDIGAMDLGQASMHWMSGGIVPTYAYIECQSSVVFTGCENIFEVKIGGFAPSDILYTVYFRSEKDATEYYYADTYMETAENGEVRFTPAGAGSCFLAAYAYDVDGNYVYFESSIYKVCAANDAADASTVYGKAKSVAASLTDESMDDYEKALALHDWLVKHVVYSTSGTTKSTSPAFHAEGALLNGKAVCQGYAEAYQILLNEAGIRSTIVYSESGNHAWNMVRLNGEWYHVDCTWDDPVGASAGYVGHTYFALTDVQLKELDPRGHVWNERNTSNSMVPASGTNSANVSYSTASNLKTGLAAMVSVPDRFYVHYTGGSTENQEATIRKCIMSVFPDYTSAISKNGTVYIVTLTALMANDEADILPEMHEVTEGRTAAQAADVMLMPESITIGVSDVVDLSVGADAVRYASSNSKCVSVNATTGEIKGIGEGSAVITARAGSAAATCKVTVGPAVSSIKLDRNGAEVGVGETFRLGETVKGTTYSIIRTSSDPQVADVSEDGTVTARSAGTAVITVSAFNGKSAACTVIVRERPEAMYLPEDIEMGLKQTVALCPAFEPVGAGGSVSYASSKSSVADVSADGVITAVSEGNAAITVRDYAGNICKVRVRVKAAPAKVTLKESSCTLGVGEAYVIRPEVPDGCAASYRFTSSAPKVALVDSDGVVTPLKTGKATITVQTYNGKKAACKISVKSAPASVSIGRSEITMGLGDSCAMKVSLSKGSSSAITWHADDDAVSVDNGTILAEQVGTAAVKVRTYNGKSDMCTVRVVPAPEKIRVNADALRISAGKSYVLGGNILPSAEAGTLTYSTSNNKVATVNSAGKISAKKAGTATITVRAYNGVESTCEVVVVKAKNVLEPVVFDAEEISIDDYETALSSGFIEKDPMAVYKIILSILTVIFCMIIMAGIRTKRLIGRKK